MFRTMVIWLLAAFKRLSIKEVAAASRLPYKRVLYHLHRDCLDERVFARLVAAVRGRPSEVALATQFIEAMEGLDRDGLTAEESDAVETGVLEGSRLLRGALTNAIRLSRTPPAIDVYPRPADLEAARWQAGRQWEQIRDLPAEQQWAVIHVGRSFQTWALVERLCEESVAQASKNLERAAGLASLAHETAERVRGPEGWRNRVLGYAIAFEANVLRVRGELKAAQARMEDAKRLWRSGEDSDGVLDPGRMLELEASLCRDQRRFEEGLALLDEALAVSRCPARILINIATTLEVLGEYHSAIETLHRVAPILDRRTEPRLWYIQRFSLAINLCFCGRYSEASELLPAVHELAVDMGDEIFLIRLTWLQGRIAAGLGRQREAKALLEQARNGFALRGMSYDVALTLLETAVLLLSEGRAEQVTALARELVEVFSSKGGHREALAAVRLFYEAALREEASAEFARRVLQFLFRARYDQGLRFVP